MRVLSGQTGVVSSGYNASQAGWRGRPCESTREQHCIRERCEHCCGAHRQHHFNDHPLPAIHATRPLLSTPCRQTWCRGKKKWESECLCLECHSFSFRSYCDPDFKTPEDYEKERWQVSVEKQEALHCTAVALRTVLPVAAMCAGCRPNCYIRGELCRWPELAS